MTAPAPSGAAYPIVDNARRRVGDFLRAEMAGGSALSFVSAYFTIYACEALSEVLEGASRLRFLYGDPPHRRKPEVPLCGPQLEIDPLVSSTHRANVRYGSHPVEEGVHGVRRSPRLPTRGSAPSSASWTASSPRRTPIRAPTSPSKRRRSITWSTRSTASRRPRSPTFASSASCSRPPVPAAPATTLRRSAALPRRAQYGGSGSTRAALSTGIGRDPFLTGGQDRNSFGSCSVNCGCSSGGRALPIQGRGRRFESCHPLLPEGRQTPDGRFGRIHLSVA